MKISINNFKSIGSLANYEMRPLTILSGTNSSGKSSFIQLLLLLKQTLEIDSSQRPLDLDGRLFKVRNYLDIIKEKNKENKLNIEFVFDKPELEPYKYFHEISFYDAAFDDYNLQLTVEFDSSDNQMFVSHFGVKFTAQNKENFIQFENNSKSFDIKTNVAVFSEKLYGKSYKIKKINYSSFIPSDYEIEFDDGGTSKEVPKLEGIKQLLKDVLTNLNYIGPLRKEPQDSYSINGNKNSVGVSGENVADVLYGLSESSISYFIIDEREEGVDFIQKEDLFLDAVKYWLCNKFQLCSDIYLRKEAESYIIYIKSFEGIESTIKHVGFGISQVLPIIVEGLRLLSNETLIIEQPEIHLHPKIQSSLSDFFIAMTKQGKKVIIETHSDHLITRLRRRIAEDQTNQLDNKTLLTFVEVGDKDVLFKNIFINDFGILELPYPDDFIERTDVELKAILKAQMKKRLNKKEEE